MKILLTVVDEILNQKAKSSTKSAKCNLIRLRSNSCCDESFRAGPLLVPVPANCSNGDLELLRGGLLSLFGSMPVLHIHSLWK